MRLLRILTYALIAGSAISLAVTQWGQGAALWWGLGAALGLLWLAAETLAIDFGTTLALSALALALAFSLSEGGSPGWASAALIAGMSAWNTGHLRRTLKAVPRIAHEAQFVQRSLLRLTAIGLGAAAVMAAALTLDLSLRFVPSLALGLVLLAGLSRLIGMLRSASQ
jgi:hypothetical protein